MRNKKSRTRMRTTRVYFNREIENSFKKRRSRDEKQNRKRQ